MDEAAACRFFGIMFPPELFDDGHRLVVWTHPSKRTRRFADIREAARHCVSVQGENVYFGVGMQKTDAAGRGLETDVTAITSLWLDVDMDDGSVRRAKTLPKDIEGARAIIDGIGPPPSALVHSGHGLQAYWLLDKPLLIEDEDSRNSAKELSLAFNETARLVAHRVGGFGLDAVHDLSRVMRVPGTENVKSGDPVPTTLLRPLRGEAGVRRYSREDIAETCAPKAQRLAGAARGKTAVVPAVEAVTLGDVGAISPRLQFLLEHDSKFRATWNKTRALEGARGDQSPSAWDFAIATLMAKPDLGFSDQEIRDAMLQFRIANGHETEKLGRLGYVMRTIQRARTAYVPDLAMQAVGDLCAELVTGGAEEEPPPLAPEPSDGDESDPAPAAPPETGPVEVKAEPEKPKEPVRRQEALAACSKALGLSIARVVKLGLTDSIYSFTLSDGRDLHIGTAQVLFNQDRLREKVADAARVVVKRVKREAWDKVVSLLLYCAEEIENREAGREGQITQILSRYFARQTQGIHRGESWVDALETQGDPFIKDGRLHVSSPELRKFAKADLGDVYDARIMGDMLRAAGFEGRDVTGRPKGSVNKVGRHYWACSAMVAATFGIETEGIREEREEDYGI